MRHSRAVAGSAITANNDPRVFRLGWIIRNLKIDELPQLLNVLKGDMSIVGPRPEDPAIIQRYYAPAHFETLSVLPGLASPGSIYNYTHLQKQLTQAITEDTYVREVLPIKLALDTVYVRNSSVLYDLRIVVRTLYTIISIGLRRKSLLPPPELPEALKVVAQPRM
jgi:lipopolysaccharide/colanic/teichoic acid biosynthesis glycosyltransferase